VRSVSVSCAACLSKRVRCKHTGGALRMCRGRGNGSSGRGPLLDGASVPATRTAPPPSPSY
jgi:hypothetical protein